jgi:transposase
MAPRRALRPISGNKQRRKELTKVLRGEIGGRHDAGQKNVQIASKVKKSPSTIHETLHLRKERKDGASLPRSGRPKKVTDRTRNRIVRYIRQNPFSTYEKIRKDLTIDYSNRLILNVLRQRNIGHWRAQTRCLISPKIAKARYQYALREQTKSEQDWRSVIMVDECSVERGDGIERLWVFGYPNEKNHSRFIIPVKKGKDMRVMICASIINGKKGPVVVMDRDEDAKKKGYSARSYQWALEAIIPSVYEPGRVLLQDNASIHTAKSTKKWLRTRGVPLHLIPPHSPDCNGIEHCWPEMKTYLTKHYKHVFTTGDGHDAYEEFKRCIIDSWWNGVKDSTIGAIYDSMPRRMEAIVNEGGWHTKY